MTDQRVVVINNSTEEGHNHQSHYRDGFVQRQAKFIARWPRTALWTPLVISIVLSVAGFYFGGFSVTFNNDSWLSMGTLIARRSTQMKLVRDNREALSEDGSSFWEYITTNHPKEWIINGTQTRRRQLLGTAASMSSSSAPNYNEIEMLSLQDSEDDETEILHKDFPSVLGRRLQEDNSTIWDRCDISVYTDKSFATKSRLWPVWRTKGSHDSALDPDVIHDICVAEEHTQKVLVDNGLCYGCNDGCLPPYSVVLYARLVVEDGFKLNCQQLADAWGPNQARTEQKWKECIDFLQQPGRQDGDMGPCPAVFTGALVDKGFEKTGVIRYTSSVFVTKADKVKELYNVSHSFDLGSGHISGAYDTQNEDFVQLYVNDIMLHDVLIAIGSAIITTCAMLVHTRSPFLTFVALIQICLSFPLAFFVYRFCVQVMFFPYLNLIGVFVVFALGADHVFLAVDKWKNARLDNPTATTEQVAAVCLPDAAKAMALPTITTAVAFLATIITTVAQVKAFAIFCSLLIVFDYILDVLVMFPCLCIYDEYRHTKNWFMDLTCCKKRLPEDAPNNDEADMDSVDSLQNLAKGAPSEEAPFIRRLLNKYYNLTHFMRWPLLVASLAALGVCCYYASTLKLPKTSDVRILDQSTEYEKAHAWRKELMVDLVVKKSGGTGYVMWGLRAVDNGDFRDPHKISTLVLDETFDPSPEDAQVYMRDFCDNFFNQSFATRLYAQCPINSFDDWLAKNAKAQTKEDAYLEHCAGQSSLPVPRDVFHPCMSGWARAQHDYFDLSWNGTMKIMHFGFKTTTQYGSSMEVLSTEWHLIENWMGTQNAKAPVGVNHAFFSSWDFWWYDTNSQMYRTALSSAAIAVAAAAVIILVSSRSFAMMLFSIISVAYVLASCVSLMVAAGWTLGFLESICFAILIGISVDFVIHFSHAYTEVPGDFHRTKRTRFALIHMGPSILAAGFTTLAAATIMMFTVILFFRLFAMVLFFTMFQGTIGSFIVFLTLTDCIGPSNPTYVWDSMVAKLRGEEMRVVETVPGDERIRTSSNGGYETQTVDSLSFPSECDAASVSDDNYNYEAEIEV